MFGRITWCAVLLIIGFFAVSCQSSNGHSTKGVTNSPPNNSAVSFIADSDWEMRLILKIPSNASLDHIRCIPSGHCWSWNVKSIWLVDNEGQWREIYTLPTVQRKELDAIESVSMISPQTGWFITHHDLYHTVDGGVTWSVSSGPALSKSNSEFRSVFFRNDNVGWLAGREDRPRLANEPVVNNAISNDSKGISVATIWQTTDGGMTWQAKELKRLIGRFTQLEFWNDIGLTFGDAGCVFTNDAGNTWSDMARFGSRQKGTGEGPATTSAYFLDHDNGWIITSWFDILTTNDGGKAWRPISSKVVDTNGNSEGLVPSNIVFADKLRGLMIAGPSGSNRLFKTNDGGKTWVEVTANEHFYGAGLVGGGSGFLLGDKGIYAISKKKQG